MSKSFLTPLWEWGLNLDLNGIERVIIHLGVPENYGFDTIISDYYSYHRDQNSYQLFRKPRFDLMLVFYYFYVSPLPTHAHIIAKRAFKRHSKNHH